MTKSMTAFGRADHGAATWEIRSVNHRYLDVSFRLPESQRHLESTFKEAFKDKVHRGKLECTLKINSAELETEMTVNEPLLRDLNTALSKVSELTNTELHGDAYALLRWPDLLQVRENTEELGEDVSLAFTAAVDELVSMRGREGAGLAAVIKARLTEIDNIIAGLHEQAPIIQATQYEKLTKRISDLNVDVDPGRLEQELVILAQKLDVMEELDRLATHVNEVRRNLDLLEPVGRRLDFLMQELNREANTISSKAAVSTTTLHAVDLKVVIEQMREQIQNIE